MNLVISRNILNYKLESVLDSPERGVAIRRQMLLAKLPIHSALDFLPYKDYDYSKVLATCMYINTHNSVVLLTVVLLLTYHGISFRKHSLTIHQNEQQTED